jgi:hypothetical protein
MCLYFTGNVRLNMNEAGTGFEGRWYDMNGRAVVQPGLTVLVFHI